MEHFLHNIPASLVERQTAGCDEDRIRSSYLGNTSYIIYPHHWPTAKLLSATEHFLHNIPASLAERQTVECDEDRIRSSYLGNTSYIPASLVIVIFDMISPNAIYSSNVIRSEYCNKHRSELFAHYKKEGNW